MVKEVDVTCSPFLLHLFTFSPRALRPLARSLCAPHAFHPSLPPTPNDFCFVILKQPVYETTLEDLIEHVIIVSRHVFQFGFTRAFHLREFVLNCRHPDPRRVEGRVRAPVQGLT